MAKDFDRWAGQELAGWMNELRRNPPPRRQFERDVTAEPSMSTAKLTSYSDEPGFAIEPAPESEG